MAVTYLVRTEAQYLFVSVVNESQFSCSTVAPDPAANTRPPPLSLNPPLFVVFEATTRVVSKKNILHRVTMTQIQICTKNWKTNKNYYNFTVLIQLFLSYFCN